MGYYRCNLSLTLTPLSVASRSRIVRILMRAEIKYGVVFIEDMLRTVAVMNIKINDEHLAVSDFLGMTRSYSDIVNMQNP